MSGTRIPLKRVWQTEKNKTITIGRKSLRMVIYESNGDIEIYLGDHIEYCIHATLFKMDDSSIGYINNIRHNSVCSLENGFVSGLDTSLCLKLLLTYIARNYPTVSNLSFFDTSSRECDNGEKVNLAHLMFVLHGKTWYEINFGAFLKDQALETFTIFNEDFKKRKRETDWDMLTSIIPALSHMVIPEEELKNNYENSETWQDFFKTFSETNFCQFIQPSLEKFMTYFFKYYLIGLQYTMPIVDYRVEYTESSYQRGGQKYTRRRAKKVYYDDR